MSSAALTVRHRPPQDARQAAPIFSVADLFTAVPKLVADSSLAQEMLGFLGADAKEGLAAVRGKRAPDFPSAKLGS